MKTAVRGVLLDLDGTLYQDGALIEGALEALQFLQDREIPHRFVTNTTSKSRAEILAMTRDLGLNLREEDLFTPPVAAREILSARGVTRAYLPLAPEVQKDLGTIQPVESEPQAVVLGDIGDALSYEVLNQAFRFLMEPECVFLTLARNRFFRGADGLNLDTGAFAAALEYATGRTAELVGKPSAAFYQAAVESLGVPADTVLMVGDDLESDVLGAQACGLRGVLVRTGKFRAEQLEAADGEPDFVIDSIADLRGLIGEASRKGREGRNGGNHDEDVFGAIGYLLRSDPTGSPVRETLLV